MAKKYTKNPCDVYEIALQTYRKILKIELPSVKKHRFVGMNILERLLYILYTISKETRNNRAYRRHRSKGNLKAILRYLKIWKEERTI